MLKFIRNKGIYLFFFSTKFYDLFLYSYINNIILIIYIVQEKKLQELTKRFNNVKGGSSS